MSIGKEKSNIYRIKNKSSKVEIIAHPEEILELDEETVAIARAKLAGLDFDEIYGDEDRTSSELMIRIQGQKIRDLFISPEGLELAFSSAETAREAHMDMMIDGIDLVFVKSYCEKTQINFKNEAEALMKIGFGNTLDGKFNV